MLDITTALIAERGDAVPQRVDGFDYVSDPIIVSGMVFAIGLSYAGGRRRVVAIDCVAGSCLNAIKYIRGYDRDAEEDRTFAVERISHLYTKCGRTITDRIPWLLGSAIRAAAGLDVTIPAFHGEILMPAIIQTNRSGELERLAGNVYHVSWRPGLNVGRLVVNIDGRNVKTDKRINSQVRLMPLRSDEITDLCHHETEEAFEFPVSELAVACGLDINGLEPGYGVLETISAVSGNDCSL